MIIGISGKIGSGKDTIAEIIQYLLFRNNNHEVGLDSSFEEFRKIINKEWSKEEITIETSFEIKKFADKLKDIVCILIGCTREQLEDREFKEKELGEEWDKYLLIEYWTNDEFAQYASKVYFNSKEEMEKYCIWMNHTDNTCSQVSTIQKMTPRLLLQLLGTKCGREIIHPNLWVNALMSRYPPDEVINQLNSTTDGSYGVKQPNWIITDVRFPNEAKAIKDKRGIVIRVNRTYQYGKQALDNIKQIANQIFENEHFSETALDDYQDWDYVIENDGTIEDLIEKVKEILIKEKLI